MLEIRLLGDSILRQRAAEIETVDEEIRELAKQMLDTMYAAEGVGLAAPQVGRSIRLFVVDTQDGEDEARVLINPRITEGNGSEKGEEGCLSLPGLVGEVERAEQIVVEGFDLEGQPLRLEASGLLARVIQHEIDHLNGVLFIDRLSPIKRRLLLSKWRKLEKERTAS